MRQFLAPILLLLLAASCHSRSDRKYVTKENRERQTVRFIELGYGIGQHNSNNNDFTIKEPVDTIPLELGKEFGVRYSLESNLDESVKVQTIWTFPDSMINSENENKHIHSSYTMAIQPNGNSFASYILSEQGELIAGKWLLSIYYQNKLLYRKVFFLKK